MTSEALLKQWDVFISHATPDKEVVAQPLAEALQRQGLRVWLDKWEIQLGDSISSSISEGLKLSRFGVVVLSKAFFARAWPRKELGTLFARESDGAKYIIPIWHNIEFQEVWDNEPLLADRMAARSTEGTASIADRVVRLLSRESSPPGSISTSDLRTLTKKLYPLLPVDTFWESQLLADLDVTLFRSIQDVERAHARAQPAVLAYAKETPSMFHSGTDYLTKALGFVDLCFRSRHNWGPETLAAFTRHSDKVRWDVDA